MFNSLIGLLAIVAIVSLPIAALMMTRKVGIDPKWLAFSMTLLVLYTIVVYNGFALIPFGNFNWSGKIQAISLWLLVLAALIKFKADFRPADAGFTLKQTAGSIKPALLGLGLFASLHVALIHFVFDGVVGHANAETLWFQALIPSLDEEPWFRGLLLYCLSLAIISQRLSILGAQINVAGFALAGVFGLAHGLSFDGTEWHFSAFLIVYTGLYGFILLWFRERTGSLIFPILAHSSVNLLGQFRFF